MNDLLRRVEAALSERYEIQCELGRGGMAVVYLGRDLRHERDVAIKVLPPQLASAIGHERFLHEIKLAAGLAHPYIVPILESGEAAGLLYYTMPVIQGETLQERLRREAPLPIGEALSIACEVAEALAHAHEAGVLHRDVKPSNILLTRDHALLSDFGVARAAEASGDERLTGTGVIVGTPAYMSPQQALSDDALDASADQYSLACVLYEMLAGRAPFRGTSAQAVLLSHATRAPPPLEELRPDVPAAIVATVARALAKDPKERFPHIEAFHDALEAGAAGLSQSDVASEPRAGRRAVGVVLLGLMAAAGVWGLSSFVVGRASVDDPSVAVPPADQVAVLPCRVEPALGASADSLGVFTAQQIWSWLDRGPELHLMPWARVDERPYPPLDSLRVTAENLGAESLVVCSLGLSRGDSVVLTYDIWSRGERVTERETLERMSGDLVDVRPVAGKVATVLMGIPTHDEPPFALTHHDVAFERYSLADRAFRQGRFAEAERLYTEAYRFDTTFALARYRAADARRWQLKPGVDTLSLAELYERHPERFGRRNGLYLSALTLPHGPAAFARFDTILGELPDDDHAHLLYGDELLHRGPLFGLGLGAAVEQLRMATELNPGSSPAWDHLAVAFILQGRESAADSALEGLRAALPEGEASATYALWRHAWRERFRPAQAARDRAMLLTDPDALPVYARSGVRLFDLPDLQLVLGMELARNPPGSEAWHSGTNATAIAHASLGRPGRATDDWHRAAAEAPPDARAEAELLIHLWRVLPGALGLEGFDPAVREAVAGLEAVVADTRAQPLRRTRAAWALARRAATETGPGAKTRFEHYRRTTRSLTEGADLDVRMAVHLDAVAAARDARWRDALELSGPLIAYDSVGSVVRPFNRAAFHLDRGAWFAELARREKGSTLADSAVAAWIWHLNTDIESVPGREVQAGEVDAGLGTHARLRIARLAADFVRLRDGDDHGQWRALACRESTEVLRRWSGAEAALDTAIREMETIEAQLRCPTGRRAGAAVAAGPGDTP